MILHILALLLRIFAPHEPALYTVQDYQRDLATRQVCQCIVLKISPEGNTIGTARACDCDE